MRASTKPRWIEVKTGKGCTLVEIKPGQFIFGRNSASKVLGIPGTSISDCLKKLVKLGNIVIKPVIHYSVITVCNFETYQKSKNQPRQAIRQPTVSQPSANRHKQEDNKKVKETPIAPKGAIVGFPPELDIPIFKAAWGEWEQHRKEKNKPITPLSRQKAMKQLLAIGPEEAVKWIDNAIAQGWQGLYPPSTSGISNGHFDADVTTFIDLRKTIPTKNVS